MPNNETTCDAEMFVAIQDGRREIVDYEGYLFENIATSMEVGYGDPEDIFDEWPETDEDGLWRIEGEIVYDDGRRLYRSNVEPSYRFEGDGYLILPAEEVTFPKM